MARKHKHRASPPEFQDFQPRVVSPSSKTLKPLTPAQGRHLQALKSQTLVIATGCAGTGKTYLGAAYAAQLLCNNEIDQIVLTRPAVEAGESLGFLKGTLEEKFAPYIMPYAGVFREVMGRSFYENCLKNEKILPMPLGYMQGMTFKNAVILADEMENADPQLMKLLLTRIGEDCKLFVSGDFDQQYKQGECGMGDAIFRLARVPGVAVVRYGIEDVVRSTFTRRVLEAYQGPTGLGV